MAALAEIDRQGERRGRFQHPPDEQPYGLSLQIGQGGGEDGDDAGSRHGGQASRRRASTRVRSSAKGTPRANCSRSRATLPASTAQGPARSFRQTSVKRSSPYSLLSGSAASTRPSV